MSSPKPPQRYKRKQKKERKKLKFESENYFTPLEVSNDNYSLKEPKVGKYVSGQTRWKDKRINKRINKILPPMTLDDEPDSLILHYKKYRKRNIRKITRSYDSHMVNLNDDLDFGTEQFQDYIMRYYPPHLYGLNVWHNNLRVYRLKSQKLEKICDNAEIFYMNQHNQSETVEDMVYKILERWYEQIWVFDSSEGWESEPWNSVRPQLIEYRGYQVHVGYPIYSLKRFNKQKRMMDPFGYCYNWHINFFRQTHAGEEVDTIAEMRKYVHSPKATIPKNYDSAIIIGVVSSAALINWSPFSREIKNGLLDALNTLVTFARTDDIVMRVTALTTSVAKVITGEEFTHISDYLHMQAKTLETQFLGDLLLHARNPVFEHIDTVIATLVLCNFVDPEAVNVRGIKMFTTKFSAETSGRDIIIRFLEAVNVLYNVGVECFTERSFVPIGNLQDDLASYARNVNDLVGAITPVEQGNYSTFFGKSEADFQNLLEQTKQQRERLTNVYAKANAATKQFLSVNTVKLMEVERRYKYTVAKEGTRIFPYTMKFYGLSGQAKSYINNHAIVEILKHNNFPADPGNISTVDETDKFDSTIKSNTTGVVMDDLCNTRSEVAEMNPAALLIRYCNNTNVTANKADVKDKGQVFILPKVIGITTNDRYLAAQYWSVCPESIMRRCDIHVDVELRPEFKNEYGTLESQKSLKEFGKERINDIYMLRVSKYDTVSKSLKVVTYFDYNGMFPELHGLPMEGVSILVFYNWLYRDTTRHFDQQLEFKEVCAAIFRQKRCECCNRHIDMCQNKPVKSNYTIWEPVGPYSKQLQQETLDREAIRDKKLQKEAERQDALCLAIADDESGYSRYEDAEEMGLVVNFGRTEQISMEGIFGHVISGAMTTFATNAITASSDHFRQFPSDKWGINKALTWIYCKHISYHDRWYSWNNLLPDFVQDTICDTSIGRALIKQDINNTSLRSTRNYIAVTGSVSLVSSCIFTRYANKLVSRKASALDYWCALVMSSILVMSSSVMWYDYKHYYLTKRLLRNTGRTFEELQYDTLVAQVSAKSQLKMDTYIKFGLAAGSVILIIKTLKDTYTNLYPPEKDREAQSTLHPTEEEFRKRNRSGNIWIRDDIRKPIHSDRTLEHFTRTVEKNIRLIEVRHPDGSTGVSNALFLRTDELIIPTHILKTGGLVSNPVVPYIDYRLTRAYKGDKWKEGKYVEGSSFVNWKRYYTTDLYHLKPDLGIMYINGISGDIKDLSVSKSAQKMFIDESEITKCKFAQVLGRATDGSTYTLPAVISDYNPRDVHSNLPEFPSVSVTFCDRTIWIKGNCGSAIIDETSKAPKIIGFHLLGSPYESSTGTSCVVTQQDIDKYLERRKMEIQPRTIEPMFTKMAGIDISISQDRPQHSPANYVTGDYEVLGYISGTNHYKTNLRKTLVHDRIVQDKGLKFRPPDFVNTRPFDDFVQRCANPLIHLDNDLVEKAAADYFGPIIETLQTNTWIRKLIKPLTDEQIINGIPGVNYVERMKESTSMGFPFTGRKSKYLVTVSDTPYKRDWKDKALWDHFHEMDTLVRGGVAITVPFKACLKDELRGEDKLMPRVFQAAPWILSKLFRKYFLPFAILMSNFPIVSECAIGINALSPEWDEMWKSLCKYGNELLAGDISKFDTTFRKEIMRAICKYYIIMARICGYSNEDIEAMNSLTMSFMHPAVIAFGTIFLFGGSQCSGQNMTSYFNSHYNSIQFRYMVFKILGKVVDFRKNFSFMTYGDDNVGGVSPCFRDKINFITMRDEMKKHEVTYTLPTKGKDDIATKFTPHDETEFLKRTSKYNPELGYQVGCLREESIWKAFMYYDCKSSETEKSILVSTAKSMCFELCAHGRAKYEEGTAYLREIFSEAGLGLACPFLNETYDEKVKALEKYAPINDHEEDDRCSESGTHDQAIADVTDRGRTIFQAIASYLQARNTQSSFLPDKSEATSDVDNSDIYRLENLRDGIPVPPLRIEQSDFSGGQQETKDTNGVVTIFDQEQPDETLVVSGLKDPTVNYAVTGEISLEEFLKRPVKVATYTWNPLINFTQTYLTPLTSFLADGAIRQRLANYAFISGRMHVKFIVNGTSFHFGQLIAAYEPWPNLSVNNSLQRLTSLPNIRIDAATASGGTIEFDIVHYGNGVLLSNYNDQTQRVAAINLAQINALKVIGENTGPLYVVAYVWMTDVRLTMTTKNQVTQAGELSLPTTKIPPTLSARIYDLPIIGKYIKASTMMMNTGLEIASMFGYSKPANTGEITRMIPIIHSNTANCNARDTIDKLALDSKNEVYVGSQVAGFDGSDHMTIRHISQREALVTSVQWSAATAADSFILRMRVCPQYSESFTRGTNIAYTMVPLSHVASAFRWWRGTLKYRVEFVGTPFHRGRMRILYEPLGDISSTADVNITNTNYSHIVDLTETRSYEFCVGWGTNRPYLRTKDITIADYSTAGFPNLYDLKTHNGTLTFAPVMPLTVGLQPSAGTAAFVYVNVYVSAGDDFELAQPWNQWIEDKEMYNEYTTIPTTNNLLRETQSLQLMENPGEIKDGLGLTKCMNNVDYDMQDDHITNTHMGERCNSIKQLLMRYIMTDSFSFAQPTGVDKLIRATLVNTNLPLFRRSTTIAPNWAAFRGANQITYRYCRNSFFQWFFPAYTGWRGSFRHKYMAMTKQDEACYADLSNVQFDNFDKSITIIDNSGSDGANLAHGILSTLGPFTNGGVFGYPRLNPVLEAEMPYYSGDRFKVIRTLELTDTQIPLICKPNNHMYNLYYRGTDSETEQRVNVLHFAAAGDDFSLLFYKYAPYFLQKPLPTPSPT